MRCHILNRAISHLYAQSVYDGASLMVNFHCFESAHVSIERISATFSFRSVDHG